MINYKSVALIFVVLSEICAFSSQALAEVYHCNGRVLRYPCSSAAMLMAKNTLVRVKPNTENSIATISQEALKKLPQKQGLWLGRVQGNGLIKLELLIFRAGNLESTRKMGQVYLADKSTAFNFKSSLPDGEDWTWKIRASNGGNEPIPVFD